MSALNGALTDRPKRGHHAAKSLGPVTGTEDLAIVSDALNEKLPGWRSVLDHEFGEGKP